MSRVEDIGTTDLQEGVLVVQTGDQDDQDYEADPETAVFGALGLISVPMPADADGAAQGLIVESNIDTFVAGIRDTRCVGHADSMVPGQTRVHSVGPNAADCNVTLTDSTKSAEIKADATSITGTLGVGGASLEVALAQKVFDALTDLKNAIADAVPIAQDGGIGLQSTILAALAAWPPNLDCTNIKGDG